MSHAASGKSFCLTSWEVNDPMLNAYENFRNSITDEGQNVFLVKLNYWLGL
jgi:hypothetical protein